MTTSDSKVPFLLCRFPQVRKDTADQGESIWTAEVQTDDGDSSGTEGLEGMWGVCSMLGVIGDREEDGEIGDGRTRSFRGHLSGLFPRKLPRGDYLFQIIC